METVINIEAEEEFKYVIDDILNSLYDEYSSANNTINDSTIAAAKRELKDVIFLTHCNAKQIYELLLAKGYRKDRSIIISSLIESRKEELMYLAVLNFNSAHVEAVSTFDWVVKLVYGTSELKKNKYPLLQLDLTTLGKGHQQQKIFDISKEMLNKTISVLEDIIEISS